jgi:ADP-ribose pyrophosphatase
MRDRRVEVLERALAYDGRFKIFRYRLRHTRFAGGMSPELTRELFERGHAAAVLPYDPAADAVVLVEQFRIGALGSPYDCWLLEPVAGIIEAGETPHEVARREAMEEAGLEILELIPACEYFVSPGGSSERCRVFIGRVESGRAGGVFGHAAEGEDIRAHVVPFSQARAWLDDGTLCVASTVVAVQWLALHRDEVRARWR